MNLFLLNKIYGDKYDGLREPRPLTLDLIYCDTFEFMAGVFDLYTSDNLS